MHFFDTAIVKIAHFFHEPQDFVACSDCFPHRTSPSKVKAVLSARPSQSSDPARRRCSPVSTLPTLTVSIMVFLFRQNPEYHQIRKQKNSLLYILYQRQSYIQNKLYRCTAQPLKRMSERFPIGTAEDSTLLRPYTTSCDAAHVCGLTSTSPELCQGSSSLFAFSSALPCAVYTQMYFCTRCGSICL